MRRASEGLSLTLAFWVWVVACSPRTSSQPTEQSTLLPTATPARAGAAGASSSGASAGGAPVGPRVTSGPSLPAPTDVPPPPPAGKPTPPPAATPTGPTQTPPPQMPTQPTGPATAAPAGDMNPMVPAVTGECPKFTNATITFMGLGGIQLVAGAKPASPTAPMVFYWHGTGSFSGEFAAMAAAVNQGVTSEGGVLVSFQGSTGGDLLSGTAIFGMGDFKLADQLLACAVRDHNIDSRRVYATGCSAGGLFSGAMAAARSSYMAAAAPNSGGWVVPVAFQTKFTPALMTIHGAPGVDVVVIDFSSSSTTADQGFKGAGGFVINCNHGGGHCGGAGLAGDIWKFFKAHPYGVNPKPWASGLPAGFSPQCKIF